MVAKGFVYRVRTSEEWVTGGGQWEPGEVLGVQGLGAARQLGYHFDPGVSSVDAAVRALDEDTTKRFWEALMGDDTTPSVPITAPGGASTGSSITRGGCMRIADQAFDDLTIHQEGYRQQVDELGYDTSPVEMAMDDPRVTEILAAWRVCVEQTTGQTAATPDELARRYAFNEGTATAEEIAVAIADATCQVSTDLQTVWYTVLTDYERALMGDQVAVYDDLVRMRQAILDRADEILRQRGVIPPSLN